VLSVCYETTNLQVVKFLASWSPFF